MIKLYIRGKFLQTENGGLVEVSTQTVAAANRGSVTEKLRQAVGAALNEEIILIRKDLK